MVLLALACRPPPEPDRRSAPQVEVEAVSIVPALPTIRVVDLLSARCDPDPASVLRASCRVELSGPASVRITLTDGVEAVVFDVPAQGATVDVPIWGLVADSEWTWTAAVGVQTAGGVFRTGPLPDVLVFDPQITEAGPSTMVQVLAPLDCDGGGWVTVVDRQGRVRWAVDTGTADVDMVQFTEDHTFVLIADKTTVIELDLGGADRLRRSDYGLPVHHDVFRRNGRIWTFLSDTWLEPDGVTYVEEIVVALDASGTETWRWQEHDHLDATAAAHPGGPFWATRFPGALDAWHTNGLYVTEDDEVILSLRHEGTLVSFSADDGEIRWFLGGGRVSSTFASSFTLGGDGDPTFSGQHGPGMTPDGNLTVFDNNRNRGLELALDEAAGTATYVGSWAPGLSCPVQSSVFALPEGHRLITCAERHQFVEYDAAGAEVQRMAPVCALPVGLPRTARGQPVDLWDGVGWNGITATRLP